MSLRLDTRFFAWCLLLASTVSFVACDEDDDHDHDHGDNEITITIEEPTNDETIALADCADVHIHIDITATDETHEIEVKLHPEGDTDNLILDIDKHDHQQELTIEESVDLCQFESGTCFHLEVAACTDHDCDKKETAEVEFCLE
ncbi:MAG: hypothetical protein AAF738_08275 [Bacteroidota bacterium]